MRETEGEIYDDPSHGSLLQKCQSYLGHSEYLGKYRQGYKKKNICLDLFVGYKSRGLSITLRQKGNIYQFRFFKENLFKEN